MINKYNKIIIENEEEEPISPITKTSLVMIDDTNLENVLKNKPSYIDIYDTNKEVTIDHFIESIDMIRSDLILSRMGHKTLDKKIEEISNRINNSILPKLTTDLPMSEYGNIQNFIDAMDTKLNILKTVIINKLAKDNFNDLIDKEKNIIHVLNLIYDKIESMNIFLEITNFRITGDLNNILEWNLDMYPDVNIISHNLIVNNQMFIIEPSIIDGLYSYDLNNVSNDSSSDYQLLINYEYQLIKNTKTINFTI